MQGSRHVKKFHEELQTSPSSALLNYFPPTDYKNYFMINANWYGEKLGASFFVSNKFRAAKI
jgi:hypothetical protein